VKIIQQSASSTQNPYLLSEQEEKKTLEKHQENKTRLRVPRRPPWTKSMTTAELDKQEKTAFLDWRRGLAKYVVTSIYHSGNPIKHPGYKKRKTFF
jgi:large subunit GTPase 1